MIEWNNLKPFCCGEFQILSLFLCVLWFAFAPAFTELSSVRLGKGWRVAEFRVLFPFAGIVNMTFPLSDQPVFGEWLIFAEMQGHTYNKSFEVQKYGEFTLTQVHLEEQDTVKCFPLRWNTWKSAFNMPWGKSL